MSRDLDRIRKLLAVAMDDRTNPNEAEAARTLAERLAAIAGVTLEEALKTTAGGPHLDRRHDARRPLRRRLEAGVRRSSGARGRVSSAPLLDLARR